MSTLSEALLFLSTSIRLHRNILKEKIDNHNAGKSTHTSKFAPWELVWYCAFPDKHKALEFEKYLKSHSGRAFAKKQLIT